MTPTSFANKVPHSTGRTLSAAAGFTLLEIILVLALIGAASMIVIPNVSSLDSRSLNVELRQAHTLLNHARRTAVVRGLPSSATFYPRHESEDSLPLAARTSVGRWQSEDTELSYVDSTDQEVAIEEKLEIVFYPEGGSTGGQLLFAQGDREVAIAVDPFTGRVSIEEDDD